MATQVTLNSGSVDSAGSLLLRTNGTTTAVTVDTLQNVGVGVTPVGLDSRFKNVEVGPTASLSSILVSSTSLLTYLQHNSYVDSSGATKFKYTGGSNYASQYNQNNGSHLWQTSTAAGTGGNACTFTTNMTLDASGNLGVGTTSPTYKITVKGGNANNLLVDNDGSQYTQLLMQRNSTANTGGDLLVDGTNGLMSLRMLAVGSLRFCTSASAGDGTERARIDSSGNLLVGTTSQAGRATIKGSTSNGSTNVLKLVDSADADIMAMTTAGDFYLPKMGSSTGTTVVLTSGNYLVKSSSSIRYKKDVEPIDIGLNFILGLNPVKYKLKEDDIDQVGFIAEDFPDARLVSESMIDPQDKTKGFQREGVLYAQIVAPLVKAIQEQQALIIQLQADVAALKGA